MTRPNLLATLLLILLVASGCSARNADQVGSTAADNKPATPTGITVFGDARIGATVS